MRKSSLIISVNNSSVLECVELIFNEDFVNFFRFCRGYVDTSTDDEIFSPNEPKFGHA